VPDNEDILLEDEVPGSESEEDNEVESTPMPSTKKASLTNKQAGSSSTKRLKK
jgi:hypothetical protein